MFLMVSMVHLEHPDLLEHPELLVHPVHQVLQDLLELPVQVVPQDQVDQVDQVD